MNRPNACVAAVMVAGALAAASAPGCGGATQADPQRLERNLSLEEVGQMYMLYVAEHKAPPKSSRDFERYAGGYSLGSYAVQKGDVVVRYGARPSETSEPDAVIAYEQGVPESGGVVLMLDGSTREMTAEEFAAAPKAGDEPKPEPAAKGRRRAR